MAFQQRRSGPVFIQSAASAPAAVVPIPPTIPDQNRAPSILHPAITSSCVFVAVVAAAVQVFGQASAGPDLPTRIDRPAVYRPSIFRDDQVEQFAPTLYASSTHPDRVWRFVLPTALHPYLARSESVENFASTLQWASFGPDTTRRTSLVTAQYPSVFRSESVENFVVPALSWLGYGPTRYPFVIPQTRINGLTFADQGIVAPAPALSWSPLYPDITRRTSLTVAQHLPFIDGEAIEQFAPILGWSSIHSDRVPTRIPQTRIDGFTFALQNLAIVVPSLSWQPSYPDRASRLQLTTAQYLGARAEAVEQFAIPALSWQWRYSDRVWALRLQSAHIQSAIAYSDRDLAVFVPPLAWAPSYQDTTRRSSLITAQYQFLFKGEAIEQFAPRLLWSNIGPDSTRRNTLTIAQLAGSIGDRQLITAPTLGVDSFGPNTTSRSLLLIALHPYLARSESVENFAPRLLWSAIYPDTTRRNSLVIAQLAGAAGDRIPIAAPVLGVDSFGPNTTLRVSLLTALHPYIARSESTGNFAPQLLWSSIGPDRTWRLSLSTSQYPLSFRTDVVVPAPTLSWQPIYPERTRRNELARAATPVAWWTPSTPEDSIFHIVTLVLEGVGSATTIGDVLKVSTINDLVVASPNIVVEAISQPNIVNETVKATTVNDLKLEQS